MTRVRVLLMMLAAFAGPSFAATGSFFVLATFLFLPSALCAAVVLRGQLRARAYAWRDDPYARPPRHRRNTLPAPEVLQAEHEPGPALHAPRGRNFLRGIGRGVRRVGSALAFTGSTAGGAVASSAGAVARGPVGKAGRAVGAAGNVVVAQPLVYVGKNVVAKPLVFVGKNVVAKPIVFVGKHAVVRPLGYLGSAVLGSSKQSASTEQVGDINAQAEAKAEVEVESSEHRFQGRCSRIQDAACTTVRCRRFQRKIEHGSSDGSRSNCCAKRCSAWFKEGCKADCCRCSCSGCGGGCGGDCGGGCREGGSVDGRSGRYCRVCGGGFSRLSVAAFPACKVCGGLCSHAAAKCLAPCGAACAALADQTSTGVALCAPLPPDTPFLRRPGVVLAQCSARWGEGDFRRVPYAVALVRGGLSRTDYATLRAAARLAAALAAWGGMSTLDFAGSPALGWLLPAAAVELLSLGLARDAWVNTLDAAKARPPLLAAAAVHAALHAALFFGLPAEGHGDADADAALAGERLSRPASSSAVGGFRATVALSFLALPALVSLLLSAELTKDRGFDDVLPLLMPFLCKHAPLSPTTSTVLSLIFSAVVFSFILLIKIFFFQFFFFSSLFL